MLEVIKGDCGTAIKDDELIWHKATYLKEWKVESQGKSYKLLVLSKINQTQLPDYSPVSYEFWLYVKPCYPDSSGGYWLDHLAYPPISFGYLAGYGTKLADELLRRICERVCTGELGFSYEQSDKSDWLTDWEFRVTAILGAMIAEIFLCGGLNDSLNDSSFE